MLRTKTTANDGPKSGTNDDEYDNDNGGYGDRRRDDEIRDTKAEDENEYTMTHMIDEGEN